MGQIGSWRALLAKLVQDLAKIPNPPNPNKSKHKLMVVLLYGLLVFVFQIASRREANRTLSRPVFLQTLQGLFPELETLPCGYLAPIPSGKVMRQGCAQIVCLARKMNC